MNTAQNTPTLPAISPRPLAVSIWKNFPALRARIQRGVEMYKSGAVIGAEAAGFTVRNSKGTGNYTVSVDLKTCTCPDNDAECNGICKHIIAAGLELAAHEELPQGKPLTLATRVLMPVPVVVPAYVDLNEQ